MIYIVTFLVVSSSIVLLALIIRFIQPDLFVGIHQAVTTVRMTKAFLDYAAGRITRPNRFAGLLIRDFRSLAHDSDEAYAFSRVNKIRELYRILARIPPVPGLAAAREPQLCIAELATLIGSMANRPMSDTTIASPTLNAFSLLAFISNETRARQSLSPLSTPQEVEHWLTANPITVEQAIEILISVVFALGYRQRSESAAVLMPPVTEVGATVSRGTEHAGEAERVALREYKRTREGTKQKGSVAVEIISSKGSDSSSVRVEVQGAPSDIGSGDRASDLAMADESVINVFISYCHQDRKYLRSESLLGYLRGLELEGVKFWYDEGISAGAKWDDEIKAKISESQIALILVSQAYLDSEYCCNVEIQRFLADARLRGLIMVPIMLSRCEWKRHAWLRNRRFLPKDDETIEDNYTRPGPRKGLFLDIRQHLRDHIDNIRSGLRHPQ